MELELLLLDKYSFPWQFDYILKELKLKKLLIDPAWQAHMVVHWFGTWFIEVTTA